MTGERKIQFALAAVMVLAAAGLFIAALPHGVAAVIGATIVGGLLTVGAVVLAQDSFR